MRVAGTGRCCAWSIRKDVRCRLSSKRGSGLCGLHLKRVDVYGLDSLDLYCSIDPERVERALRFIRARNAHRASQLEELVLEGEIK